MASIKIVLKTCRKFFKKNVGRRRFFNSLVMARENEYARKSDTDVFILETDGKAVVIFVVCNVRTYTARYNNIQITHL